MLHLFFHDLTPPAVKLDADLEFVLRVAFGPSSDGTTPPQSGDGAWRRARQLGLERRIAERLTADRAREFLGPVPAREVEAINRQIAADILAREEAQQRLIRAIDASGIEVVLVRQAAVYRSSATDTWTQAADIDVLVQDLDREKLTSALINAGCKTRLRGDCAVFLGQQGAAIVLHTQLRFLRMVPGGAFIDLACLKRCGYLLRDDVTQNKSLWLPSRAVQAADFTAQALVEQRFAPEYPAVRGWLEAQALGLGQDEDLAFDAYLMLQTDVEYAEFEALRELLRALSSGELKGISTRARTLLNHAIAAATVPSYRARLHLQRKAQVWQHEGHLERAAEGLGRALRRIRGKF